MILEAETFDRFGYKYDTAGWDAKIVCGCDFCGTKVEKRKSHIKESRKISQYDCCNNKSCKVILSIRKGKTKSLYEKFQKISAQLLKTNLETGERQPDPKDIPYGSQKKLWWDEGCGHGPFEQSVCGRTGKGSGCPKCGDIRCGEKNTERALKRGSLATDFSEIAAQLLKFNPETGERQPDPEDIPYGSGEQYFWDENCGHGPFEQMVRDRTGRGSGCPKCADIRCGEKNTERALKKGSLAANFSEIAAQLLRFNPETGQKQPEPKDIPYGSQKKLWWDEGCEHGPFEQKVCDRTGQGSGCPKCGRILQGKKTVERALKRGSLAAKFSEIAAQLLKLNPETGERQPDPKDIPCRSGETYFWDENCGHGPFEQMVRDRTGRGSGCPKCGDIRCGEKNTERALKKGSLAANFSEIAAQLLKFNPETKERQPDPKDIPYGSKKKYFWDEGCSHGPFEQMVSKRTRQGQGCPKCGAIRTGKNHTERALKKGSLATNFSEIAAQLLKTNPLTGEKQPDPKNIPCGSNKKLWWDEGCGHEPFEQAVSNRTRRGNGCPKCDASHGEELIAKLLKQKGISFKQEWKPDGLKHKNQLSIDFVIMVKENMIAAIEFQGIQHYESVNFFGGEEALAENQIRDQIKRYWCRENNIPLLEVHYEWKDIEEELDKFLSGLGIN